MHSGALWFSSGLQDRIPFTKVRKELYHKPSLSGVRTDCQVQRTAVTGNESEVDFLYCFLCNMMIAETHILKNFRSLSFLLTGGSCTHVVQS